MIRKMAGAAFLLALLVAGSVPCVVQGASERKIRLHLAGLDAVYAHPMADTAARVAAVPGVQAASPARFEGSLLCLDVTTTLDDRLLAEALGMVHVSTVEGRVLLAPVLDARARRAEARMALLAMVEALEKITAADLRDGEEPSAGNYAYSNSSRAVPQPRGNAAYNSGGNSTGAVGSRVGLLTGNMERKLRVLGLAPAILQGTYYKAADYHMEVIGEGVRLWAGTQGWVGYAAARSGEPEWDEGPANWDDASQVTDERFVGVQDEVVRGERVRSWQDNDNLVPPGENSGRRNAVNDGKLVLARGTEVMTAVLARAAGWHLENKKTAVGDRPAGRGWNCLEELGYNTDNDYSWRWNGRANYSAYNLNLRWQQRETDKHKLVQARFFTPGHALYMEAEVDVTAVELDYEARDKSHENGTAAEVAGALRWVFGAEQSPEEFALRRAEQKANFAALLAALKEASGARPLAQLCGPLTEESQKALGAKCTFACLAAAHYHVRLQAFGDVLMESGNPSTGGRVWMLGNVARQEVLRSSP